MRTDHCHNSCCNDRESPLRNRVLLLPQRSALLVALGLLLFAIHCSSGFSTTTNTNTMLWWSSSSRAKALLLAQRGMYCGSSSSAVSSTNRGSRARTRRPWIHALRASSNNNNCDNRLDEGGLLYSALLAFRLERSKLLGKSPSLVLGNALIDRICATVPLPQTEQELLAVKGLGPKKMNDFGTELLAVLSAHAAKEEEESASSASDSFDDDSESDTGFAVSPDSYVAPAPYAAPAPSTPASSFSFDSYVAPAPYSYADDDDDIDDDDEFEEDYIISEESFGAAGEKESSVSSSEESSSTDKPKKISKTQLRKDLKDYRMLHKEAGKAAYTVFTNAALEGIYKELPMTKNELLDVKGIGPKKMELYGDDILAIVAKYTGVELDDADTDGDDDDGRQTPLPAREKVDPESLTPEQRRAADLIFGTFVLDEDPPIDWLQRPPNVFVTGSAGTGKSHLLKYVVETLRDKSDGDHRVGVCAPTGVAAVLVGGSTLHSFFGIGLGTGSKSNILQKVRKNSAATDRIDATEVLIIDECSMMSADLLETLDMVARRIRKGGLFRDEPFGGMQVICFGDFFQLPPVFKRPQDSDVDRTWRPFCFESPVWNELGLSENIVELKDVQRQEHEAFIDLLNKVRVGRIHQEDIHTLNDRCLVGPHNPLPNDGILPTKLYVLNRDVDSENIQRLDELATKEVVCEASDSWRQKPPPGTPASTRTKMKESLEMEMPTELRLKVGAQVMLTRNTNLQRNLVNGSRGVVERFVKNASDGRMLPVVRFDSGIVTKIPPAESERWNPDGGPGCLVRKQIPLKLAWAITIHKSQGSTLTRASLDISSAFEYGQCYVALSRVKSLEGLWLEQPANLRHVKVSPQVVEFFESEGGGTESQYHDHSS